VPVRGAAISPQISPTSPPHLPHISGARCGYVGNDDFHAVRAGEARAALADGKWAVDALAAKKWTIAIEDDWTLRGALVEVKSKNDSHAVLEAQTFPRSPRTSPYLPVSRARVRHLLARRARGGIRVHVSLQPALERTRTPLHSAALRSAFAVLVSPSCSRGALKTLRKAVLPRPDVGVFMMQAVD